MKVQASSISAQAVHVSIDGYRLTPSAGWMGANLGKDYLEDDWVPYRFVVENANDTTLTFGSFSFDYDHYDSGRIGFDQTKGWRAFYTGTAPAVGDPPTMGGTAITPASKDAGTLGSSARLVTSFSAGTLVIPPRKFAVVAYEAHLSVTAYWRSQTPPRDGSGFYPGSSLQMRVDSPSGDKTVTLPLPPAPPGCLQGLKYNDLDHDGTRDAGEPPLAGWVFHLAGGSTAFPCDLTATSDANGVFSFPYLVQGPYTLTEQQHAGWSSSTAFPLAVTVGSTPVSIQVGNFEDGGVNVVKFDDLDGDGVRDAGEGGLVRSFTLTGPDGYTHTASTGADGHLSFNGLAPGSYTLSEAPVGGTYESTGLLPMTFTLAAGEDKTITVGNTAFARVNVLKFNDLDGDGVRDAGEGGLVRSFVLTGPGGYSETLASAADGSVSFTGLVPGSYTLDELPSATWFESTGQLPITFTLAGGETREVTVGNAQYASVNVFKFNDLDADGVQDTGDVGMVRNFTLTGPEGYSESASTDSLGNLSFTGLIPGSYTLTEDPIAGWAESTGLLPYTFTLSGSETKSISVGNFAGGTAAVVKYDDLDGDGVRDAGEPGLVRTFTLSGPEGYWLQQTTDASGNASFGGLHPGEYTLTEEGVAGTYESTGLLPYTFVITSGETESVTIGNTSFATVSIVKFDDSNANGERDPGEAGLVRTFTLTGPGGYTQTASTDPAGDLSFTGLTPGSYTVSELVPAGWSVFPALPMTFDLAGGESKTIVVGNTQASTVNIGKFNDMDGDGVRDPGEAGLVRAFTLVGPGGYTATESTDASGNLTFTGLAPGSYTLSEAAVDGTYESTGLLPMTFSLAGGETRNVCVGNTTFATADVVKYDDLDGDGFRDAGEPGLVRSFTLTGPNGYSATASTDASGNLSFTGLKPGDYTLEEAPVGGTYESSDLLPAEFHLDGGENHVFTIGNTTFASVAVVKYNDLDGDGTRDAGEGGLVRSFTLAGPEGFSATVSTDASGNASFTGLVPGTYTLTESPLTSWFESTDLLPQTFTLNSGDTRTVQIGNTESASVSIAKYNDLDGDGTRDAGEGPLVRSFTLTGPGGYSATASTDASGNLVFEGLRPGAYSLSETAVPGWSTDPAMPLSITLVGGQDFAVEIANSQGLAAVNVVKFNDADGDGVRDGGENGLVRSFTLTGPGQFSQTASTDASGSLGFSGLVPGTYTLSEAAAAGTYESTGLLPLTFTLAGGDTRTVTVGNTEFATVSIVKYNDLDGDGVRDAGEAGLVRSFTLTGPNGFSAAASTDSSGNLSFDGLKPGAYTLSELVPEGWSTNPAMPIAITLVGGQRYAVEVANTAGSVVNIVKFNDMDGDGVRDAGEGGLVRSFTLTGPNGYTSTASTDASGSLSFTGLAPGSYTLSESALTSWFESTGLLPQSFALAGGEIRTFTVGNAEFASVGILKYNDVDGDGIRDAGESGLVRTFTLSGPGGFSATASSDASGNLAFTGLVPGSYTLSELVPEGWSTSPVLPMTVTLTGGQAFAVEIGNTEEATNPAITVVKSADLTRVLSGTVVQYTYVVSNSGDTDLFGVHVVDDKLGTIGDISLLAVGTSQSFTATAAITVDTVNVVTATGQDRQERTVSDTDSASVTIGDPAVSIVKTADPAVVVAGAPVVYTYVVTNTGNETLFDLTVVDDQLGEVGGWTLPLAPAASFTLTADATLSVDTVNVGTVTGSYGAVGTPWSGTVTDDDSASVDVVSPAIDVTKVSNAPELGVPIDSSVLYTYTVTNTGDVPLISVSLVDDKLGSIASGLSLAVGETRTFTSSAVLSADTTNTVVATGFDVYQHQVTDSATAFVPTFLPFTPPDLTITKDASVSSAGPGDVVTYTLRYRNLSGDAPVDFTITDTFDGTHMEVVDANGGVVSGNTIVWTIPGPLAVEDGWQTLTYTMRVKSPVPEGTTHVPNTVVIATEADSDPTNNSDTASIDIGESLPFLPFTGGEFGLLPLWALLATAGAAAALLLRRRVRAS